MSVTVSVERLRMWLLLAAGLLVLVVAAFVGYAHYRAHRFLTALPAKLGIDVRQEGNSVTWSQSVGPNTVYTLHAAKTIEHNNGSITLRDVEIVVYGKKENRADRIYGKEFELDQKAGVIRAMGKVFIDLQAPAKDAGKGAAEGKKDAKAQRVVHVKTSGLVYLQKLGVAATEKEIEFSSGGLVGHAVGADYNADTGVVILHSAVKVEGEQNGRPVMLTASRAVLDRTGQTAALTQASYATTGQGKGETARADHAMVWLRKDGSAERLQADGNVTLTNGMGGKVVAPKGEMLLSAENHPQSAVLTGGVKYVEDSVLRQAQGGSAEGRARFDKLGRMEHAWMTGAVHLHERVRAAEARPWSERDLNAGAVELAMLADAAGKTGLQDAKATGDARLKVVSPAVAKDGTSGVTSSAMAGDVLTAHFVRGDGKDHIAEVHGDGHTTLRKVAVTGAVNASSGDSLVAKFRPVTAGAKKNSAQPVQGEDEIVSAVEQGHVVMTQTPVKKPGETADPHEERAVAEKAVYDGELDRMTLTGNVQVDDGLSMLWADRVVTEQATGDSTADGGVKASYTKLGSGDEPVHVLASRAEFKHDAQLATFYGAAAKPARMWQATSQVEAPVLEFAQKEKRLLAHGQGAPLAVHTVLVKAAKEKDEKGDAGKGGLLSGGKSGVFRIASRELAYSDDVRRADFTGGVQVDSAGGVMRGEKAVAYLTELPKGSVQAKAAGGKGAAGLDAGGFMGGSLERIVATGLIDMEQPGRRATGSQLVYTASDGLFVLTGAPGALPKVVDQQQGTVTGVSLSFHAGDENVVVSNGGEAGQKVRTETRVKSKR